ncbi:hypothetical protein ACS5LO_000271 [Citrobacter koseri]
MKRVFLGLAIVILTGCASKPFEATNTIYEPSFLKNAPDTTKIRVHRVEQLSGSALGEECPLVLKVDEKEVAGLQQNQFVDVYLPNGNHKLSVRFKCALTEWRKSVDVIANGHYQEYQTETGIAGQYRMWQVR